MDRDARDALIWAAAVFGGFSVLFILIVTFGSFEPRFVRDFMTTWGIHPLLLLFILSVE